MRCFAFIRVCRLVEHELLVRIILLPDRDRHNLSNVQLCELLHSWSNDVNSLANINIVS